MASMAARAAPSRVSTTLQPINLPASPGARKLSPNISARRCKKCRARARRLSRPSNHRRRSRWTEWRASDVKWKDDTHPPANIFPTIIFLVYIAREPALQDHRAEIVAEEAAHRELALLLIA